MRCYFFIVSLAVFLASFLWKPSPVLAQYCSDMVKFVSSADGCTSDCKQKYTYRALECRSYAPYGSATDDCKASYEPRYCKPLPLNTCYEEWGSETLFDCGGGGGGDCLSTAPACGGSCGSGFYCRPKVSDPSQCVCAENTGDGCNGGYFFECKKEENCRGTWSPGGNLSCSTGDVSCRGCCKAVNPSTPTLVSPANGAVLNSSSVNLQFIGPSDWGSNCPNLNPTITLRMGISPTSMTVLERYQEAAATSVRVVGSNIEISGFGFPGVGGSVGVKLDYQSAPISFAGVPKRITGGYAVRDNGTRWMTYEEVGDPNWSHGRSYCQSMVGRDGWNKDTSQAWFVVNGTTAGRDYDYGTSLLCGSWNYYTNPSATNTVCNADKCGCAVKEVCGNPCVGNETKCCGGWYCPEAKCCPETNTTQYGSTVSYTSARTHSGTYQVQSDGIIRVPLSNLPAGGISSNLTIRARLTKSTSGFTYNLNPGTYYWKVSADNGAMTLNTTDSATWSFTVSSGVSGTVYYDPGNTCSTATPTGLTGGMTLTYSGGTNYNASVPSSGTSTGQYSINAPSGSGTLTLNNIPAGFGCSTGCGIGCPTATGVVSPTQGNNFFVTDRRAAWWQARGAGIYAGSSLGGTTVRSLIPSTVAAASRYLILPGTNANGALLRSSGTTSLLNGAVSTNNWSARTSYKGKKVDYAYLAPRLGVTLRQPNDWGADTLNQPGYDVQKEFYYHNPSSVASISNAWSVAAGEKYIVLVDGNLNINQDITVATGGFLAFIVKGSVTVAPTVTRVDGLLLMDNTLVTQTAGSSTDTQLTFNGSVVAWGGVSLLRDMGIGNNSAPAELFSYRQDLITNMPNNLKVYAMEWREVPAGSFGD